MLHFHSASVRMANSQRAMLECLEAALGVAGPTCDLLIVNSSIGHDLAALTAQARAVCPAAIVVAASCAGVVGREGVSESLNDVAVMAVQGQEFVVSQVDGLVGDNAYEKGLMLADGLLRSGTPVNMVYLIAPGIDNANDRLIQALQSRLGQAVTLFGATSGDNMRAVATYQAVDGRVSQRTAFAVGFFDPTLEVITRATHGFVAVGEPLLVTSSRGHRILAFNGKPAWPEYLERLGLPAHATIADAVPIGALAERLPPDLAAEYGNEHILRAVTLHDADGAMHYPTTCPEGTPLWLTVRDEERIFNEMDRMLQAVQAEAGGRKPVAVFQADCGARGRLLFNRVMKEELIQRLQHPFSTDGAAPPWLGLYGFGEFARLAGTNTYHNYTTAIAALYRKPVAP